ncbi:MAG TPA: hypothetical protein IAC04_07630, partial [Candidatus Coprenecus stercoravium]|nr:hypothetical protein [Candidatus Coprenecus stercoravium]
LTIAFGDEEGNALTVTFKCSLDANSNVAAGTYSVSKTYLDAGDIRPGEQYAPSSAGFTYLTTAEGVVTAITGGSMIVSEGEIAFNFTTNVNSISATYKGSISVAAVTSIGSTMTEDITGLTFDDDATVILTDESPYRLVIYDRTHKMTFVLYGEGTGIPTGEFTAGSTSEAKAGTFVKAKASWADYWTVENYSDYGYPAKYNYVFRMTDFEVDNKNLTADTGTGLVYFPEGMQKSNSAATTNQIACPAWDGTINITEAEGVYTVKFDLKDDVNHAFSGEFTFTE